MRAKGFISQGALVLKRLYAWGCSSVGRAVRSQRTGRRFDPDHLHQLFQGFSRFDESAFLLILGM